MFGRRGASDANNPHIVTGVVWGTDGYARRIQATGFAKASSFISAITGTGVQRRDGGAIEMHQTGLVAPQQSVFSGRAPITNPTALLESDMSSFPGTQVPTDIALLGLDSRTGTL